MTRASAAVQSSAIAPQGDYAFNSYYCAKKSQKPSNNAPFCVFFTDLRLLHRTPHCRIKPGNVVEFTTQ
jgi:hypothetical protein